MDDRSSSFAEPLETINEEESLWGDDDASDETNTSSKHDDSPKLRKIAKWVVRPAETGMKVYLSATPTISSAKR